MKNLFHIFIVSIIALIFVLLHHSLWMLIQHGIFLDKPFHLYFGWFSWSRVADYSIFTVSGLLAGFCVSLLVHDKKTYLWPSITGILMIVIYSKMLKVAVFGEERFLEYFFIYSRSVMFLAGSVLAACTYTKAKKQLTKHST